jgi:CheY-like chemotaxis protein
MDVLVVDDDPDLAGAIKRVLESQGYRCRCACNGARALDEAASAKPSLVLLDMVMPVMHGWDCARALRTLYGDDLPIVLVSAAADAERADVGADGVLPKPFGLDDLLRVVGTYAAPTS